MRRWWMRWWHHKDVCPVCGQTALLDMIHARPSPRRLDVMIVCSGVVR